MFSKSRCRFFVAIDSTNPIYRRTIYLFVCYVLTNRSPTTPASAYHTRGRGVELTCSSSKRPTSAHTPSMEHNIIAGSRRPYPLSMCPPPSARTRTPTPRGMPQCCRTGRAVDQMNSWFRSKGVSPDTFGSLGTNGHRNRLARTFRCPRLRHRSVCD